MPRGISPQREKEYEELLDEFHRDHRYLGREEEVASRIINKQRAQHGETIDALEADKHGKSPDRNLPISNFDRLDVDQIVAKLDGLERETISAPSRNTSRRTAAEAALPKNWTGDWRNPWKLRM